MAELAWSKIIEWGILIVFLLIIILAIYSPQGFFKKLTGLSLGAERFLPTGPQPELKSPEPLPTGVENARSSITTSLSVAAQTKTPSDCIVSLQSLTNLENFQIEVANTQTGATISVLQPNADGAIRRTSDTITGMSICLADPQALYDCYLQQPPTCKATASGYKQQSTKQAFSRDDLAPYAYKIDGKTLCLIPKTTSWLKRTVDFFGGCTGDDAGIRESCITELSKKIKTC